MEKNDLNNKAMLDISNALVNMSKAMKGLNGTINKMVKENLTPKEQAKHRAYMTKYLKLKKDGKEIEAKELYNKYISGK